MASDKPPISNLQEGPCSAFCVARGQAMNLATEGYVIQNAGWPGAGRHILAHHDAATIVVYQAYRPSIGAYAIRHGTLDGDFSYRRMSWIKPNFLWMMYRSGWGTKQGQEVVLGFRLQRQFFDSLLSQAVASTYAACELSSREEWAAALARSNVRLQWDPDHDPGGKPLARRAIQLGLRGPALLAFGKHELLEVIDMTQFVAAQRQLLQCAGVAELRTPVERPYVPADASIARRLQLD